MTSFKPTRYLLFEGFSGENDKQVTMCTELNRGRFFKGRRTTIDFKEYFYEGNDLLVWARFESEYFALRTYEDGLRWVIAWFDGRFTKRNLYDG